jgi:hypothetical protein
MILITRQCESVSNNSLRVVSDALWILHTPRTTSSTALHLMYWLSARFFATYVAFEAPCSIVLKITVSYLMSAFGSDRVGLRSPFMFGACLALVIGYTMNIASEALDVRLAAVFVLGTGVYASVSA